jgi:hypothetical protein
LDAAQTKFLKKAAGIYKIGTPRKYRYKGGKACSKYN